MKRRDAVLGHVPWHGINDALGIAQSAKTINHKLKKL